MEKAKDEVHVITINNKEEYIWVSCADSNEKRKVVKIFESRGYSSKVREEDFGPNSVPRLVIYHKDKVILHIGASHCYSLQINGVIPRNGTDFYRRNFIKRIVNTLKEVKRFWIQN